MRITLLVLGKTNEKYLEEGIGIFFKRLKNYVKIDYVELKDVKNYSNSDDLQKKEAHVILEKIKEDDYFILLDENGIMLTSEGFSQQIEKWHLQNVKHAIFLVGGAFGVHQIIKERADFILSFSKMTFSH
ncbi:MAG: 23S rRNA (pseudouridine(1915)-N(3))-methyltransferase RlmH, partial [Saprospiraceae bacterium]